MIHETAIIEDGAEVHQTAQVWHWAHIRKGARIGRDVVIGQGCYIDQGVNIPDGCKIQNHVSVYYGVHLGRGVFVGPHAVFCNDKYPRANKSRDVDFAETFVGEGASIGAGAVVVCGAHIGHHAMVGAGSVVAGEVPPRTLVKGRKAEGLVLCKKSGRKLL